VTAGAVAAVAAVQYLRESRQPVENLDLPPTTAGAETGTAADD